MKRVSKNTLKLITFLFQKRIDENNYPGFPIERVPSQELRNQQYEVSHDLENIHVEGINGLPGHLI